MVRSAFRRERWVRLFHRLFPERQIMVRTGGRVRYVHMSRWPQVAMVGTLTIALSWIAYSSVNYFLSDRIIASKEQEVRDARRAYRSLLTEVSSYQRKFASITHDLEENHSIMVGLVEQNSTLQQSLENVETKLQATETERNRVLSVRERLKGDLLAVENKMQTLVTRNFALKDNLSTTELDLQQAIVQRNQAMIAGTHMKGRISSLEADLRNLRRNEEETIERLTEQTLGNIEDVERLLSLAGLKVDKVLEASDFNVAQGGPFIAAKEGDDDRPGAALKNKLAALDYHLDRWSALRGVLGRMPLTVPVNNGYVTSRFGKRKDPFNKKWAMHYGLDYGGPKKSPIYVTAPGVVTYAGRKSRYGRMVEVDHGGGLKTIYGHLHKAVVKKGDKVTHRQKIGLMGSSGRSTGVHLHYEIRFKGKPLNPLKFIQAGRNVFQG
ncbi:M23 family metallopeptidase [Magnetospira sp. QH-2]|uniref:M23 family metallopeptidase n=1 Tax=Magnetospira sp. (strain QH-2) TaxID=1288970 RepID=UPI0003E80B4B|nr:M23 family metallopeptidase [Magnetospira sp. QH-2]CCQ73471.1 Putative Peptidase M23B [Magnetospira sp. QH-2]